jgi:4-hydroxybenzoate polyprenyltransferase
MILTTLHAQDFADVEGDSKGGRKTFPILFPTGSRIVASAAMVFWSTFLCQLWSIGPIYTLIFVLLGCWLSTRFWFERSVDADKTSYVVYNVREKEYRI